MASGVAVDKDGNIYVGETVPGTTLTGQRGGHIVTEARAHQANTVMGTNDDTGSISAPLPILWVGDRRILLRQGANRVGREPGSEVRLNDVSVSRAHARIDVQFVDVTVVDLNSKNGTWVRGVPIHAPAAVNHGDDLMFGTVVARLVIERPDDPTTAR